MEDKQALAMAAATRGHIVAVPYPAQGHITPLFQLCARLQLLGFDITFVNTLHNHSRIFLQSHPFSLHSIRALAIPGGSPPELHGFKDTSKHAFLASQDMAEPFDQLLSSLMQHHPPVSFILSDVLLGWTQASATKFGIPRVAFWAASAATLSSLCHFSNLVLQGNTALLPEKHSCNSGPQTQNLIYSDIPGLPPMHQRDLPVSFDDNGKISEFMVEQIVSHFHHLTNAPFVLVNSFSGIESDVLDALSSKIHVCAVGPLLPSGYVGAQISNVRATRPSLFLEDGDCLAWLDTHKPGSVLYISFGSISVRSNEQLLELAMGLEASEQPFLWVLRSNPVALAAAEDDSVSATDGFIKELRKRTKGRGVVVPWVAQLEVLAHASVGGFMTHCGWNSVVESVAMGVAMLCWADTGERRCNQKFVVDVWQAGMKMSTERLGEVEENEVTIGRKQVEKVVRKFMSIDKRASMRVRVEELQKSATIAASRESCKHLDAFSHTMASRAP